ncbi:hypothetical protein NL676_003142 [Syzygium grande]|nr:hypothetical protein NL676_003142 [Syzygium grande]
MEPLTDTKTPHTAPELAKLNSECWNCEEGREGGRYWKERAEAEVDKVAVGLLLRLAAGGLRPIEKPSADDAPGAA